MKGQGEEGFGKITIDKQKEAGMTGGEGWKGDLNGGIERFAWADQREEGLPDMSNSGELETLKAEGRSAGA